MESERIARRLLADPAPFSLYVIGRPLRLYQLDAMRAILRSFDEARGDTITVMMARQAGKNELSAHLKAYLLNLHARRGG